jgi:hypothetical protein
VAPFIYLAEMHGLSNVPGAGKMKIRRISELIVLLQNLYEMKIILMSQQLRCTHILKSQRVMCRVSDNGVAISIVMGR